MITTWVHRLAAGLRMLETPEEFAVMHPHDTGKYRSRPAGVVADRLALYGAAAASYLEDITDEELTAVARLPGLGVEWTVQSVVETSSSATPATTRRASTRCRIPKVERCTPGDEVSSLGWYSAEGTAGSRSA